MKFTISILSLIFFFAINNSNAQSLPNEQLYAQNSKNDDGFSDLNNTETKADSAEVDEDWFAAEDSLTENNKPATVSPDEEESRDTVYPLVEVGGATIVFYLISWLLTKFKIYKTSVHRKIWNVILLISFVVSGILGLVLVFQINYDVLGNWYGTFMWLHVDFGIVMALTSIFHILWHTKYFGTMLRKKKS
ncbi:MAG: hypothetical protein H6Q20_2181 [Bacteroidetes bacterium]|nr:hypothetical protein [Bacteroidota bacterium]